MARSMLGGEHGRPPTSRADLPRRRLVDMVTGPGAAPLTVVHGPSGMGKSVLLAQIAYRAARSRILHITSADQLSDYLHKAVSPDQEPPDLVLLDAADALDTDTLRSVLGTPCDRPRVVVATRRPLKTVTSSMLLDGSAHIISAEDLLFTPNEVIQLASKRKIQIDTYEAADLHLATDGWPAMVDAALRLRRPGEPIMHRRVHELVNQFVREELLGSMPDNDRARLTMAAALPQFDAQLLAATLADLSDCREPEAALLIEHWSAAGWVIRATSAQYWRMPQPVRQSLLTELDIKHPGRRVELVDRAVRTLVSNNRTSEALPYLVEASTRAVSDVLREQENQLGTDASWALLPSVKSLADDDLADHPALLLVAAISRADHRSEHDVGEDADPVARHREPGEEGVGDRVEVDEVDRQPSERAERDGAGPSS
jgi:LuxR family transcriptional regulator, maltose regulon positive regulatory protein